MNDLNFLNHTAELAHIKDFIYKLDYVLVTSDKDDLSNAREEIEDIKFNVARIERELKVLCKTLKEI